MYGSNQPSGSHCLPMGAAPLVPVAYAALSTDPTPLPSSFLRVPPSLLVSEAVFLLADSRERQYRGRKHSQPCMPREPSSYPATIWQRGWLQNFRLRIAITQRFEDISAVSSSTHWQASLPPFWFLIITGARNPFFVFMVFLFCLFCY